MPQSSQSLVSSDDAELRLVKGPLIYYGRNISDRFWTYHHLKRMLTFRKLLTPLTSTQRSKRKKR